MRQNLDEKEIAVLDLIASSEEPIGSWFLVEKLEEKNINTSSATTGRILNKLENLGYLKKESVKGRIITKEGINALRNAKTTKKINYYKEKMDKVIKTEVLENYLMTLQARKAIERETAKLAARNITNSEICYIESILKIQEEKKLNNESIAENDINFHKAIAKASRNSILESLYTIISTYGQQSELFEYVRNQVNTSYRTNHRDIFEAIKKRDEDLAEECMVQHIENLSRDVLNYWHVYKEQRYEKKSEGSNND